MFVYNWFYFFQNVFAQISRCSRIFFCNFFVATFLNIRNFFFVKFWYSRIFCTQKNFFYAIFLTRCLFLTIFVLTIFVSKMIFFKKKKTEIFVVVAFPWSLRNRQKIKWPYLRLHTTHALDFWSSNRYCQYLLWYQKSCASVVCRRRYGHFIFCRFRSDQGKATAPEILFQKCLFWQKSEILFQKCLF